MFVLNSIYLSRLSKEYEIKNECFFIDNLLSYCLNHHNTKESIYLYLCKDFDTSVDVDLILKEIACFDQSFKNGTSYLCVIPMKNPSIEMCTNFNGKSFVHFVFFDSESNNLFYDKDFYYFGSKKLKRLINLYELLFDDWKMAESLQA